MYLRKDDVQPGSEKSKILTFNGRTITTVSIATVGAISVSSVGIVPKLVSFQVRTWNTPLWSQNGMQGWCGARCTRCGAEKIEMLWVSPRLSSVRYFYRAIVRIQIHRRWITDHRLNWAAPCDSKPAIFSSMDPERCRLLGAFWREGMFWFVGDKSRCPKISLFLVTQDARWFPWWRLLVTSMSSSRQNMSVGRKTLLSIRVTEIN